MINLLLAYGLGKRRAFKQVEQALEYYRPEPDYGDNYPEGGGLVAELYWVATGENIYEPPR